MRYDEIILRVGALVWAHARTPADVLLAHVRSSLGGRPWLRWGTSMSGRDLWSTTSTTLATRPAKPLNTSKASGWVKTSSASLSALKSDNSCTQLVNHWVVGLSHLKRSRSAFSLMDDNRDARQTSPEEGGSTVSPWTNVERMENSGTSHLFRVQPSQGTKRLHLLTIHCFKMAIRCP